ncbi:MAG: SPOR domain-containing protein [Bacteroidetes bacterium]|nr:SPOR domain-containing protein [Bacteroidota bacterium]
MNKYFIQLFLEESTVIIPNLGALTVTNEDTKEIMFLPYLKFDDGKLADFISKTEGVDKVAASNMISKFAREIQATLDQGDSYDIFDFGSFSKNEEGEIEFTSVQMMDDQTRNDMDTNSEVSSQPASNATEDEKSTDNKVADQDYSDSDDSNKLSFELNKDEPIEEKISSEELLNSILNKNRTETPELEIPSPEVESIDSEDTKEEITPAVEDTTAKEEEVIKPNTLNEKLSSQKKEKTKKSEPLKEQLEKQAFEENVLVDKPVVKAKKKKRISFAYILLWLLLFCFVGVGVWTFLNFDKVKPHIPFLADKKEEYKSPFANDEEHIKVMKELSGITDSTDIEEGDDSFEEPIETPKITPAKVEKKAVEKEKTKETPTKVVKPTVAKTPTNKSSTIIGNTGSGNNFIIVGSFSSGANADNLAAKLKKQGFDATTLPNGTMTMVSAGSFSTVDQAQEFLSKNSAALGNGWVLKK